MANNNIILPTDFSVDSLNLLIKTLEENLSAPVNIIFVHGIFLSQSITELLFYSEGKLLNTLYPSDYDEALKIVQNKYASRINSIKFRLFHGVNKKAFENFIEGIDAKCAYISDTYKEKLTHKRSFNIIPFIKKSTLQVIEVNYTQVINGFSKGQFSENTLQ